MEDSRRQLGNRGEHLAELFLIKNGMKILARQFRTPFGEIDLVGKVGDELVFVEVKTRLTDTHGYPEESVTREKIKHLVKSAQSYLQSHQAEDQAWRIDVVAIRSLDGREPEIVHFKALDLPYGF